jgi:hypothetical protein
MIGNKKEKDEKDNNKKLNRQIPREMFFEVKCSLCSHKSTLCIKDIGKENRYYPLGKLLPR